MILVAYDGSADARSAIEHACELLRGQPATVLTVWEPFARVAARAPVGFGIVPLIPDSQGIDQTSAKRAHELAEEGADQARGLGLEAHPRTSSPETTVARAILTEAEAVGAGAIVIGSRGLTGLKSLLLGSVSHEVIQHADRTVIVVPSPGVAAARSAHRPD